MSEKVVAKAENIEKEMEGARVFYFRHSKAVYGEYTKILGSDNPEGSLDVEGQALDDLTEAGHELAQKKAREFLATLDLAKDTLFVVSSDISRALQTAAIYAKTAREMGFNVIEHKQTGTEVAQKIGEGYVRSIDQLSLGETNSLVDAVYNPPSQLAPINWDNVDPEVHERWNWARQVIEEDDKGSWGANLFAHSDKVREFFPEGQSSQHHDETTFKNLLRLARFAKKKAGEQRIDVLAFGHENYVGVALERDTGDHALPNCEGVEVKDGKLVRIQVKQ